MHLHHLLPAAALLLTGASAINITVYANKYCTGNNDMRSLYVVPEDGCFKKGEYETVMELNGIGGWKEMALAVGIYDLAAESHYVAFFSSDDCDPDNVIEDAYHDGPGCNNEQGGPEPRPPTLDYKSWAVWDMCMGEMGCSLEDE